MKVKKPRFYYLEALDNLPWPNNRRVQAYLFTNQISTSVAITHDENENENTVNLWNLLVYLYYQ